MRRQVTAARTSADAERLVQGARALGSRMIDMPQLARDTSAHLVSIPVRLLVTTSTAA
jgi:hypothetical protein